VASGALGFVSVIDDQVFGDLRSFREQFADLSQAQVFATLKRRLQPICCRIAGAEHDAAITR
jgi:hypothetical protein